MLQYMYRLNFSLLSMMLKSASILMTPFILGCSAVKQQRRQHIDFKQLAIISSESSTTN